VNIRVLIFLTTLKNRVSKLKVYKPVNGGRIKGGYRLCESCDFTRSNCLIYIKSENMLRKSGKIINKIGENRNFHIVGIDTAFAPI